DVVAFARDPDAEPKKTVHVRAGGSVTLYLPQYAGTKWTVALADKRLGEPKEETIPGLVGTTPRLQLTWSLANKALLPGDTQTIELTNTKKGETKPDKKFTLVVKLH